MSDYLSDHLVGSIYIARNRRYRFIIVAGSYLDKLIVVYGNHDSSYERVYISREDLLSVTSGYLLLGRHLISGNVALREKKVVISLGSSLGEVDVLPPQEVDSQEIYIPVPYHDGVVHEGLVCLNKKKCTLYVVLDTTYNASNGSDREKVVTYSSIDQSSDAFHTRWSRDYLEFLDKFVLEVDPSTYQSVMSARNQAIEKFKTKYNRESIDTAKLVRVDSETAIFTVTSGKLVDQFSIPIKNILKEE
jgi:hypothetical protein